MKKIIPALAACFLLSACFNTMPDAPDGFYYAPVKTEYFSLVSYEKNITPGNPIRIYVEGNGNPSPRVATALQLAANDISKNVIYLARPCQYTSDDECSKKIIWTDAQYNREIIAEMKSAVTALMRKHQAPTVEFVGYDGGAAMALLLATRIPQTTRVITVAGILDTDAYAHHNKLTPLKDSLNPISEKNLLANIPQIHYVGRDDKITTPQMARRFVNQLPKARSAVVKLVTNVDHGDWDNVEFSFYKE